MPHYYFDVEDGDKTVDEEGLTLQDAAQVPTAALAALFDVARYEAIAHGERHMMVEARDEAGKIVYRASLALQAGWVVQIPA